MHLAHLFIENFRVFGAEANGRNLDLDLEPGLTLLVGPNDGGKSAIIDAVRFVLRTSANEFIRLTEQDFHFERDHHATSLRITCRFDLTWPEAANFFEYITPRNGKPSIFLSLVAKRQPGVVRRPVTAEIVSGPNADGPRPSTLVRELLEATYLRALRDALAELSPGRGSRLSKILASHPKFQGQDNSDYDPSTIENGNVKLPNTLRGIMALAEDRIKTNDVVSDTRNELNSQYLRNFSVVDDPIVGRVGIAKTGLREILEKLDLWIDSEGGEELRISRGLGTNNILFMAAEMLLVRSDTDDSLPLLLIEEPEAHLHPQQQLLVSDFLEREAAQRENKRVSGDDDVADSTAERSLQVLITTHSPTLASRVSVEQLVVVNRGQAYPLRQGRTKLDSSDYRYLRKFLDATRANLFFAHGVIIVEGDAEQLLLPTLFEILGEPLAKHGISIVRVGTRGLFRYSRIFQGGAGHPDLPIRVACIADLDPPDKDARAFAPGDAAAKRARIKAEYDGGPVRAFVADRNTFEYDLAYFGLGRYLLGAITLARFHKNRERPPTQIEARTLLKDVDHEWQTLLDTSADDPHTVAETLYAPLRNGISKAETAQYFAELLVDDYNSGTLTATNLRRLLPPYIHDAITYLVGSVA